jgi:outer membrane protein assembly factor BamB
MGNFVRDSKQKVVFESRLQPKSPSSFMPSSSSRNAERNVRLDPMGIYGTRSERRRQQLQRRRQLQNVGLWLIGIVALGFGGWWIFQPHPTLLRAGWTHQMPFQPATAPVAGTEGQLLLTSQSGGLWSLPVAATTNLTEPKPKRIFATAFAPGAAPLVGSKTVFWPGSDGILRSLDLDGKEKWSRALPSTLVIRPALARTKNRPIVAVADDEGHLAAFDGASGQPLWTRPLGGAAGEAIAVAQGASPAFIVPTLAGVTSRGGLLCFDATSGQIRWRFPTDLRSSSPGIAAPALAGGNVYWCNDEGAVVALDGRTGRKIWKSFATPRPKPRGATPGPEKFVMLRGAPAVAENAGVVVVGGSDSLLRAFDQRTGAPRWTLNVGGPALFAAQVVAFEGQEVLLASGDAPSIFLLDAASGRVLRRWGTPFNTDFGVVAVGNTALALDAEGHLQGATLR